MRLGEILQQLKQFHPDSQVDIYNVIPLPEGEHKYMRLKLDRLYLEDDGATITIELSGTGLKQ